MHRWEDCVSAPAYMWESGLVGKYLYKARHRKRWFLNMILDSLTKADMTVFGMPTVF